MAKFIEGLDLGAGGPVRIADGATITGEFFAIEADGEGDLVLASIQGLEEASTFNGLVLAPGQRLLSGKSTITSITSFSGSGWAYKIS